MLWSEEEEKNVKTKTVLEVQDLTRHYGSQQKIQKL